MQFDANIVYSDYLRTQKNSPLVHNITNYVVMQQTANALLAIGAAPVMAHAQEEVSEMTTLADALVINIGTLSAPWITSMHLACETAKKLHKPIVFDPVGAGATRFRTDTARDIVKRYQPTVIRGNAAEIAALFSDQTETRGVDSTIDSDTVVEQASIAAKKSGSIICISGKHDFITNGTQTLCLSNGHPLMSRVTGMGCTATALIAALCAGSDNYFTSTASAMTINGIVGEIAATKASGVGSFPIHFLDSLGEINHETLQTALRQKNMQTTT